MIQRPNKNAEIDNATIDTNKNPTIEDKDSRNKKADCTETHHRGERDPGNNQRHSNADRSTESRETPVPRMIHERCIH
jgi:hypothetical protein